MDLSILEYALWFVVSISVLVAAHEFGHFIVARKLGFKVLRFSIGFGRPLLSWRGGPPDHIQYWLSMIPLGGYVKMLDEHEGPVVSEERHRAFHQRPVWQRIAVLLAGPAFNFLFAILAYWLMFVTGVRGAAAAHRRRRAGLGRGASATQRPATRSPRSAGNRRRLGKARRWGFSTSCSATAASISRFAAPTARFAPSTSTCAAARRSSPSRPCCSQGWVLEPGQAAVIGSIVDGSPAEQAGLQTGRPRHPR